MAELSRVTRELFPRILPLLQLFPSGRKVARQWEHFVSHHWPFDEGHFGFALESSGVPVGFLGLVFSRRRIGDRTVKICNPTSWIVHPDHRSESLALLSPLADLTDYTVVNMTPSAAVLPIFRLLGFRELEASFRIFLPRLGRAGSLRGRAVRFGPERVRAVLDSENSVILDHHRDLVCHHIALVHDSKTCYIVATRRKKRRLTIAHIHYISDLDVFLGGIHEAVPSICMHMRVAGVQIDERLLQGRAPGMSVRRTLPQPRLYKSRDLAPGQIDGLYTELVFLGE